MPLVFFVRHNGGVFSFHAVAPRDDLNWVHFSPSRRAQDCFHFILSCRAARWRVLNSFQAVAPRDGLKWVGLRLSRRAMGCLSFFEALRSMMMQFNWL